jgi:hypothetical protein
MIRIGFLFLLASGPAAQESSTVAVIADRVTENNPEASLRAIATLAAMPSSDRAEIEKASAGWAAYYRDALQAQWKSRESLKGLVKPFARVTLRGKEASASTLFSELRSRTGLEFAWEGGERFEKKLVDIESVDSTPMEALADLSRASTLFPADRSAIPGFLLMEGLKREVAPWAAGHFGLFLQHMGIRERVDFSAPPERVARMMFVVLWDKEIDVSTIRPVVRLVEAVADTGEKLALSSRKPATSVRESEEYHGFVSRNRNRSLEVPVVIPSLRTARITRLRFVATALVPRRVKDYSIEQAADPSKGRVADEDFEITVTEGKGFPNARKAMIRIRPLKMKPEELAELPLTFKLSYARAGEGQTSFRPRIESGAVEYTVWWYPVKYQDPLQATYGTEVESVQVRVPLELVEWPIYVDLKGIPLR